MSDYYKEIKYKKFDFPDFNQLCPICHKSGCAEFHGFYYREVIDENGTIFKSFPIARYKCNSKGRKKVKHTTFSLLPYQLIPYCKYSIDFIFRIMKYWKKEKHTIMETLNLAFNLLDQDKGLSSTQIYKFAKLLESVFEKLIVSNIERVNYTDFTDKNEKLKYFIDYCDKFCSTKFEVMIRGPTSLNIHFYLSNGGYLENASFLFGTPSQFRE